MNEWGFIERDAARNAARVASTTKRHRNRRLSDEDRAALAKAYIDGEPIYPLSKRFDVDVSYPRRLALEIYGNVPRREHRTNRGKQWTTNRRNA